MARIVIVVIFFVFGIRSYSFSLRMLAFVTGMLVSAESCLLSVGGNNIEVAFRSAAC
jgi:hypothetical protein